jgi:hypothetical protein
LQFDPLLASPLELMATGKHDGINTYTDMVKVYPQLLRAIDNMTQDPVPYLRGEKALLPGTRTQQSAHTCHDT